jgi:hypothetical protein
MSVARMLSEKGYDTRSERDLNSWNSIYDIASVTNVDSTVMIWQIR